MAAAPAMAADGQTKAQALPAPVAALAAKGVKIAGRMAAPDGFQGFLGNYDGQPVPVYLLPGGKVVSIGSLYDAHGNDLTQEALRKAASPNLKAADWRALAQSRWFAIGAQKPRRIIYLFVDTECGYCHQLWQKLTPYLSDGEIQLRLVLVAMISPKSEGRAAAILEHDHPGMMWARHEAAWGHSPIQPLKTVPAKIAADLKANAALMHHLGAFGTPTVVYRQSAKHLRLIQGLSSPAAIKQVFGVQ
nr:thiol:disulfide interchange protein DsbG [Oleiagrimonas sp. C23AA]